MKMSRKCVNTESHYRALMVRTFQSRRHHHCAVLTTGTGQGYSMNHSTYMVTPRAKSFSYSVLEE